MGVAAFRANSAAESPPSLSFRHSANKNVRPESRSKAEEDLGV